MKIFQAKKYYEFIFERNKIEFLKTNFFKEIVLVNGKMVSEKFSVRGTEHFIKINSTEILLQTRSSFLTNRRFRLNLFVNRNLVESKTLQRKSKVRL